MKTPWKYLLFLSMLLAATISFATNDAQLIGGPTDSPHRKAGNIIFISTQIPLNPETRQVPSDIHQQVKLVLDNLKAEVNAAGATMNDVVKITVYMDDIDTIFPVVKEYLPQYFSAPFPARSPIGGLSFGKSGFRVAIDATVYLK